MGCCTSREKLNVNEYEPPTKSVSSSNIITKYSQLYKLKDQLTPLKKIGQGAYGQVYLCKTLKFEGIEFAMKFIKKCNLSESDIALIKNEVQIFSSLDHPNIAKYVATYENSIFFHILMEYIPGQNVKEQLPEITEEQLCELFFYLLKGIYYLKLQGIIHRDLKLAHILLAIPGNFSSVKLIDFGLSVMKSEKDKNSVAGTPFYMAPEVVQGNACYESDIWSVGVMLYYIVTGKRPFQGANGKKTFKLILNGNYDVDLLQKAEYSDCLKSLIKEMLIKDKHKRISVENALKHKWFDQLKKKLSRIDKNLLKDVYNQMLIFQNKNVFQKEICFLIGKTSKTEEILKLENVFHYIDFHTTGAIELDEFEKFVKECDPEKEKEEIKLIFKKLDIHQRNVITYSDFIAATLPLSDIPLKDRLLFYFKYLDNKDTGKFSVKNFTLLLARSNLYENLVELNNYFEEKNIKDCEINYPDFVKLVFENNAVP